MSQFDPKPDTSAPSPTTPAAESKGATAPNPLVGAATPEGTAPTDEARALKRRAVAYLLTTAALMALFYALAYHSWDTQSWAGRMLVAYLEAVAQVSAASLRLFGEQVTSADTTVSGRFSYVVVVDCAALDVQALFVAAVLAFPSPWKTRLLGVAGGVAAIFAINIARLVVLYYAGATSLDLFNTLHEEVFVLVIVALVCGLFLLWARWATPLSPLAHAPKLELATSGKAP
jgi:exosortase/archaeosortase family protein